MKPLIDRCRYVGVNKEMKMNNLYQLVSLALFDTVYNIKLKQTKAKIKHKVYLQSE